MAVRSERELLPGIRRLMLAMVAGGATRRELTYCGNVTKPRSIHHLTPGSHYFRVKAGRALGEQSKVATLYLVDT